MTKIIGDIVGLPSPRSDWNQNDEMKADFIKNRPIEAIKAAESLYYYGDANIIPSDASLFSFTPDNTTMTVSIKGKAGNIVFGDVVIPYKYASDGKTYIVTTIKEEAFNNRDSITSVTIPNSVVNIMDNAFVYCDGITRIIIPKSVTSIGQYAFFKCSALTDIYYKGSEEDWSKIVIGGRAIPDHTKIHFNYSHEVDESPKEVIHLANNMRIEAREDGIYLCGVNGDSLLYEEGYNSTKVDLASRADEALNAHCDTQGRDLKGTVTYEYGDNNTLDMAIYDGVIASCGVISTSLMVSLGSDYQHVDYISALYFRTPSVIPENYSQFPADIYFKGDSTDNGAFVPEANMRYTIVFDFDGYMMNAYVSGVTTV